MSGPQVAQRHPKVLYEANPKPDITWKKYRWAKNQHKPDNLIFIHPK